MYKDFAIGFFDGEKGVYETLHVLWSKMAPQEMVTGLNVGKLSWDIEGKYLYDEKDIVAKTETSYWGADLDELIKERAFFLPDSAH